MNIKDITGDYMLYVNGKNYDLSISGKGSKQTGTIKLADKKITSKFSFQNDWVEITLDDEGYTRLMGKIITGKTVLRGNRF